MHENKLAGVGILITFVIKLVPYISSSLITTITTADYTQLQIMCHRINVRASPKELSNFVMVAYGATFDLLLKSPKMDYAIKKSGVTL